MTLTPAFLTRLLDAVRTTRPDEMSCADCDFQLSMYAQRTLAGRDAAEAMPLLADHLVRCPDCREEFEALLAALREIEPLVVAEPHPGDAPGGLFRRWRR